MTAFALTAEQQDFAERVRDLASGQLRALAEAGTPGHVNRELIKAMGDLGLLSRLFPGITAGGLSREAAAFDLCILREALATQSTEAARLLVYAAAAAYDAGADGAGAGARGAGKGLAAKSAMAKLFATETAQYVADAAVQIHGARALQRGHLLEHLYREVRAPRIYEGASEVQRTIIARELYR